MRVEVIEVDLTSECDMDQTKLAATLALRCLCGRDLAKNMNNIITEKSQKFDKKFAKTQKQTLVHSKFWLK